VRVRFKGKTGFMMLTHNKTYDVLSIEHKWYRVVDDSGDDYLYPNEGFEIVEGGPKDLPEDKPENWWHGSRGGVNGIEKIDKEKEMSARALLDADLAQARAQRNREKK
jgi:hypothetical protein